LKKYGFDEALNSVLTTFGINDYMTLIGFKDLKEGNEAQQSLVWIFLSPIIFFITASILKDYFRTKDLSHDKSIEDLGKKIESLEKKLAQEESMTAEQIEAAQLAK